MAKAAKKVRPGRRRGINGVTELSRHVDRAEERLLWTWAAGRCQFAGCNKPLWKSSVTQERVNIAQKAHIYAFSADGPRGHKGVTKAKLNKADNLLLVCHGCHRKIDQHQDGGPYTVSLLRQWKAEHERRIEIVTGVNPSKSSHLLLFGGNIADHSSPVTFSDAATALFPTRYPADDRGITLGAVDGPAKDSEPLFWEQQAGHLTTRFAQRVSERLSSGEIEHVSVFAKAPQPLLILLGSLLTDLVRADVYQLHRDPQTWAWPEKSPKVEFLVNEPRSLGGTPALVIALTSEVATDRITAVIGPDAAIWTLRVKKPSYDLIKSRKHLTDFRAAAHQLIEKIKLHHGQTTPLHIFPVSGVAPAVELGRIRQPKAQQPWILYDHVNARGGFVRALSLPLGD